MNNTQSLASSLFRSFIPTSPSSDGHFRATLKFDSWGTARTFAHALHRRSPRVFVTVLFSRVFVTSGDPHDSRMAFDYIETVHATSVRVTFDAVQSKPHRSACLSQGA